MNYRSIILGFCICLFVVIVTTASTQTFANTPSSPRSREVINRVTPHLNQELQEVGFALGSAIFIKILKQPATLSVYLEKNQRFELFKTYSICNFSGELGPKLREGDLQSPEGFYFVHPNQLNPNSQFHLSFNLGYPNAYDRAHARTGSALMVHGNCVSIGCYAMGDPAIEEIYTLADAAFKSGQAFFRVHIFPFEMSESNLLLHKNSQWFSFWQNLKEGSDHFETHRKPANVSVVDKRYVFGDS